jgi:radical SAM superfamily enzyme YgiQ (UPF0313 family)
LPEVLLFIPPLTQLNTPYPATAYLTGFLKSQGIPVRQADLGLDLVLSVFHREGFKNLFDAIELGSYKLNASFDTMLRNRKHYESTVDAVISFLQNKNYTLGYRIANGHYLPEGNRFKTIKDIEWFFGNIGVQDKARYKCTMYLEDVSDLIQATVGPHFAFSKYAERIARTASSFDPLQEELEKPTNYFDALLIDAAKKYFEISVPDLVGFTVPFGGNLYGALKVGQWIKAHYPQTKIAIGGGYPNTELRDLYDPRVFDYIDYITLDDGERPIASLLNHISDPEKYPFLKRTFLRMEGKVEYINNEMSGEFAHGVLPAPSYEGLRFHEYLSVIDMPNPMHRLWNDGRWNKLTIAHGCYWKKCSFCDVSLDYISRFEQSPAKLLVDKMEALIKETGETGFHFVDEAAPPLAMRDLALEIIRRGLQVTWWTNIRFEKTFSEDLCKLLAASGCIAVTGGLEVASPRLLELMEKGITIDQVARVCKGFRDAGILVHAYLMYGFPTETEQETIDSLEIVRQLFQHGLLQSAHWHQFAMTAHSPVGLNPEKYHVIRTGPEFKGFANNDLYHSDPTGAEHEKYSAGLKKALYNYMHHIGIDFALQKFFSFPVPKTKVHPANIGNSIASPLPDPLDTPGYKLCWYEVSYKLLGKKNGLAEILFFYSEGTHKVEIPEVVFHYIEKNAAQLDLFASTPIMLRDALSTFSESLNMDAEKILRQDWWKKLREHALWVLKA